MCGSTALGELQHTCGSLNEDVLEGFLEIGALGANKCFMYGKHGAIDLNASVGVFGIVEQAGRVNCYLGRLERCLPGSDV